MTLHSNTSYKCSYCQTFFVPFSELSKCPKCNRESPTVYSSFIEDTIRSARYNLANYDSFMPGGWVVITIGDNYFWLAFSFLKFAAFTTNIKEHNLIGHPFSRQEAQDLANAFLKRVNFGNEKFRLKALKRYLPLLLCIDYYETVPVVESIASCFLCYSTHDKDFCDKLYSDLLASGIVCWYFPEDATYGKKVWGEIDAQIRCCTKVIVVCSKSSLNSQPVLREIERALQREDAENRDILLPINIDDYVFCNWSHSRKADVIDKVIGDFKNWNRSRIYSKSFSHLLDSVTA